MLDIKKNPNKKELRQSAKTKKEIVKYIKNVEQDLEKEIEVRKIDKPNFSKDSIHKSTDLFGKGFNYFIEGIYYSIY